MAPAAAVFFSSFRLDLSNRQLWRGEGTIPLRPKTFAVLRYLVEHAGRLVTREELVAAAWQNSSGAEKGPKRCILELRTALGERASTPHFIETVGRVGYRFIAPVSNGAEPEQRAPTIAVGRAADEPPAVGAIAAVDRQAELARLRQALSEAVLGTRRIVFVTGEAGIGKTSVVDAFLRDVAVAREPSLAGDGICCARGHCVEQFGEGEAYLPVLQAMGRLVRGPDEAALAALLRCHAPSWLAQLPALAVEEPPAARQPTQRRMLREIGDLIRALTRRVPLVLVLEDLHWSDYSTLDFLSWIAQDREPARLLLIATYRGPEVADDHPLRTVTQELLSHGQAREVPLAGFTQEAVQQYLGARFPRHAFSAELAPFLVDWTDGNPLFLVNLVDDLIAQGLLAQDDGKWALQAPLETFATRIPVNSRLLIEKQMGRLDAATQSFLEAGSVAGLEFVAETVAAALLVGSETVEHRLDALARLGLFVRRLGIDEWPDGTATTRYGFRHTLHQRLWSERIPASRRQAFHLRISERLERSYGPRAGEIAAALAVHFDGAGDRRRGVEYRARAAQNALRRSAHREAIDHLTKALQRLAEGPETPERTQLEISLQIVLGVPLTATKGYAAPEVERTYRRALELCDRVEGTPQIAQSLLGLWVFYFVRADLPTARRLAQRCLRQTEGDPGTDLAIDAHNAMGATSLWLGELIPSRAHLEQSLAPQDLRQDRPSVLDYDLTDPRVSGLSHLAWALWCLGHADQAMERVDQAVALARRLMHPYSLGYALIFAAIVHCLRREREDTREHAEEALALAVEHGFPLWSAMGTVLKGWALVGAPQGRGADSLSLMRKGLAAFQAIGVELGRTAFLGLLADACLTHGRADEALAVSAEASALADERSERLYAAELHRLWGESLLASTGDAPPPSPRKRTKPAAVTMRPSSTVEAERHFLAAIQIAREQGALSWELRAATSLTRLWYRQGRTTDALTLLAEVYGQFGAGFETHDLSAAKVLLRELRQDAR